MKDTGAYYCAFIDNSTTITVATGTVNATFENSTVANRATNLNNEDGRMTPTPLSGSL